MKIIIILLIGFVMILISGCNQQPQQCYYDCPDCICDCTPDVRSVTKFEYPDNIQLFNDKWMITNEEIIGDYTIQELRIRMRADKDGLRQGSICVEHKFDNIKIYDLLLMPTPDNYKIRSQDYKVDCWLYVYLDSWESYDYDMLIEQGINQNQIVNISIWKETKE